MDTLLCGGQLCYQQLGPVVARCDPVVFARLAIACVTAISSHETYRFPIYWTFI